MSLVNKLLLAFALFAVAVFASGCASLKDDSSVVMPGYLINVTKGPLTGNLRNGIAAEELKKGKASEVLFFQWYIPWVSAGNETLREAMEDGGITELHYADYSMVYCLVIAFFNVTAYGK